MPTPTTPSVDELRNRLVASRRRLAKAIRKQRKWEQIVEVERSLGVKLERSIRLLDYPPEPAEGKVVRFQKLYRGQSTTYSFAAVRGGDRWWVTGDGPQTKHGITWQALCDFVRSGNLLLNQVPRPQVDADSVVEPPF